MGSSRTKSVTQLLQEWDRGDQLARDQVMTLVYHELRRLARGYMRRERCDHTLQTTALVNEAYMRLVGQNGSWQSQAHFFAVAAQLMRRILVDHARARRRAKRGGSRVRVTLDKCVDFAGQHALDLVALDQALSRLAELDPRPSRVVELRFFGGLTIRETAQILGVSHTIVEREWNLARAWLRRELEP